VDGHGGFATSAAVQTTVLRAVDRPIVRRHRVVRAARWLAERPTDLKGEDVSPDSGRRVFHP